MTGRSVQGRSRAPRFFYPLAKAGALLLALLVGYLSLTPDPAANTGGFDPGAFLAAILFGNPALGDKVSHVLAYAALGGAFGIAFGRTARSALLAGGGLLLYGALLEILQGLGGVRQAEGLDLLANLTGIVIGLLAALILRLFVRLKRGPSA